jgi:hypothetical protein
MKAGGKAPEALGCDLPVPIATRPPQKIYLPIKALKECRTKLSPQHGIIARSGGKSGIKGSGIDDHANTIVHEG